MSERAVQTEKVTEDKVVDDMKQKNTPQNWKEALLRTFLANH